MTEKIIDLQELKKIDRVDVYKRDILAAKLVRTPDGVSFQYDEAYVKSEHPPIATTLPKTLERTFTKAGGVPPFFAGLLPEGRRLSVIQKRIKTSADDELSVLIAIGADTVGDVKVLPYGEKLQPIEPLIAVKQNFSEIAFAELLEKYGEDDGVGIAGVQEKVSAKRFSLPASRANVRFILKLPTAEFPLIVENESYFLSRAKKIKMNAVASEIVSDREGVSALLVKRFDRVVGPDGKIESLAVEDACQVMGRWPSDKYSVSSEEVILALSGKCASEKLAKRDLYRQFCFAWISGNGDLHAKNVSIMQNLNGEWNVTPTYDIPSTLPYGDISMAIEIIGKSRDLTRNSLLTFGEKIGLARKLTEKVLEEVLQGTEDLISEIASGVIPFNEQINHDFAASLRRRRFTALSESQL